MNPTQPNLQILTRDREHLSGVLYRTFGFVTAELLHDTLELNPHLTELPYLYPAHTLITLPADPQDSNELSVQTLWS